VSVHYRFSGRDRRGPIHPLQATEEDSSAFGVDRSSQPPCGGLLRSTRCSVFKDRRVLGRGRGLYHYIPRRSTRFFLLLPTLRLPDKKAARPGGPIHLDLIGHVTQANPNRSRGCRLKASSLGKPIIPLWLRPVNETEPLSRTPTQLLLRTARF